jgi:hypothetical protein
MKDIDSRLKLFLGMIVLCSFVVIHVHFVYNDCTIKVRKLIFISKFIIII